MHCQFIQPPAVLRHYIRYFWTLDFNDPRYSRKILNIFADRYPRLIYQHLNGRSAIRQQNGTLLPPAFLSGVATQRFTYQIEGNYSHTAVSFYPHGLKRFFCLDAQELVNKSPDLRHFSPLLLENLYCTRSHTERIGILTRFFMAQLVYSYQEDWQMTEWLLTGEADRMATNVAALLKKYRLSERQLERKFKTTIGISPMTYLRIVRFERALRQLSAGNFVNLTDVAYDLAYADQSHFTREFKTFSGYTPKAFVSVMMPVQDVEESSSFLTGETTEVA